MSRINIITDFIGSTVRLTLVNSGVSYAPLISALFDVSSTLVSSVTAASSGNGHYYADHGLPLTRQRLVNEWLGVSETNTYRRFQIIDVQHPIL